MVVALATTRNSLAAAGALRLILGAAILTAAALHAWSGRHVVNIDGISYLDLGDAFARGDWAGAVNGHWSPLYAAILGLAIGWMGASPYWELATAHLVNVVLCAGALLTFDVLLREAWLAERARGSLQESGWPAWAWFGIGYLLFAWASLQLISLWIMTPDLAVAGVVYLAAALILAIRRGESSPSRFALLGAVLGVGYLIKAPLFPLAFVFLAVAAAAIGSWRLAATRVAVALVVFAVICGPFIAVLSMSKGRLTFGDSRTLAAAWFVNQVPFRHWREGRADGRAEHPTRRVLDTPAVYEFASPVGGTYPVWFDPSYWHEGIRPRWAGADVARTLTANARSLVEIAASYVQGSLLVGLICVMLVTDGTRALVRRLPTQWPLLSAGFAGLAMFSVVSVFPRYIAPFLVLSWLGVLGAVRVPAAPRGERILATAGAVMMLTLGALLAWELGPSIADGVADLRRGEQQNDHQHFRVADGLGALGLAAGQSVAIVHPDPAHATWAGMIGWARVARARVVAEVEPAHSAAFWTAAGSVQEEVLRHFARAGATMAVSLHAPPEALEAGWRRVGSTDFFAYDLSPLASNASASPTHQP